MISFLFFCDADNGSDQFVSLVDKIGETFFKNKENAIEVFIFANPVTLQIVLCHFGDVVLSKIGKKSNSEIVEELTGIKDYKANQNQIREMIEKIHFNSIELFKERLKAFSRDFKDIPSTNFLTFLERFESSDSSWIDYINAKRK